MKNVAFAVKLLTSDEKRTYLEYVQLIQSNANALAVAVKTADLTTNIKHTRIPTPTHKRFERIEMKYKPALPIISS